MHKLPMLHSFPVHPGVQIHLYEPGVLKQVPPFSQRTPMHSLMSMAQVGPVHPRTH
ncbi:hypothetical protein DPMN_138592 [Dreissena polymorpha]|uniref:Uncharacterized protein n=1 Tax=Dreissena polymorpha TaxID=45954 RepID=A0A9D4G484_DREPO|nr:hypothetical protein DPMN_134884 [Dreissena polymorpha]KAH3810203.1 hypothetical protein DPMN_138592 [Dreissena polymorpha]